MVDAASAMGLLDSKARELDELSKALAYVERRLEPAERDYQEFVENFEVALWRRYEDSDGRTKLPSESLRLKLAHREMSPELLGRYVGLLNSRKRLEKRISALKATVDAQRSILSALKTEMEATSAGRGSR